MAISPVSLAGPLAPPTESIAPARSGGDAPFGSLLQRFLGNAVHAGGQADSAVRDLALGNTDNLHEVMLQVAQADLSFRLLLEIRNRLSEAYQEIMKMQM